MIGRKVRMECKTEQSAFANLPDVFKISNSSFLTVFSDNIYPAKPLGYQNTPVWQKSYSPWRIQIVSYDFGLRIWGGN